MMRTFHTILIVVALLVAALFADAWLSARRTSTQLASTLATQNAAIQKVVAQEEQRATQLSGALATITAQKREVQTPQEAAAAIPSLLPQLPLPLSIDPPDVTASHNQQSSPNPQSPPPASLSIPQPDLKPLYDDLQDCRICTLERDATKKNLTDEQAKVTTLTHERDTALAAAHGGSFWSRLKQETKWLLIGLAAGAAARAISHR